MNKTIDNGFTFVIFGGTGDLANRKLIPAIYHLFEKGLLPNNFSLVSIGRRDYSQKDYYNYIYDSLETLAKVKINDEVFSRLKEHIYYKKMNFLDSNEYGSLNKYLEEIDQKFQTSGNRLYYLAVSPDYFDDIISGLQNHCMNNKTSFHRLMIEKPFGNNLMSASNLNKLLVEAFSEENIYRVDHYLGKEMLQNIMVLRFSNIIFESLWNHKYIEQVQISSNETLGIETRGNYYEQTGAIRDMVQSHMLQLLSLVAMEKPKDLSAKSIHNEKVKLLKSIKNYSIEELRENVIRGQYGSGNNFKAYREEDNVSPNSNTDTFVALKLEIDNTRWQGVPFYIRTGKRMAKKSTEIIIEFKHPDNVLYNNSLIQPNTLIIKIQPTEGVFMQFNAKTPGSLNTIVPVQMDFCQNCEAGINSPEAYERLLYDAMRGDSTLFARWDEVELSWKFIDQILDSWKTIKPDFPNYNPGENGPIQAYRLLDKSGHRWLNEEE